MGRPLKPLSLLCLGAICALPLATTAHAAGNYNANFTARITDVATYPGQNHVIFWVDTLPANLGCAGSAFEIEASSLPGGNDMVLSRLLLAYGTQQPINIGYDSGACTGGGFIWVARVG